MQFPATRASSHILSNGLTVILEADHTAPVISTQIWVETGSIHEGAHLGAGISHLLEHMVFKGTESYSGSELSDVVQAAGGEWNAYTTFDRTVYYIDGPAESTQTFLKVLSEMVFKPSFPEDEFEKEKGVIRREIDMGLDDPDDRNGRLLYSTALANDPRKQPVIGHMELFNRLTHQDMLDYHRQRYTTENTFLSISGDFDTQELLSYLEEITADIDRQFNQPVSLSPEPAQLGTRIRRETFAIPSSKLTLAWQTPSLEHPDAAPLDLLATILGSGRSSRLYQNIREKTDLCHHIGSWSMIPPHLPGLFAVSAIVDLEKRDSLQDAILQQINELQDADLDEEIQKAVRMTLSSQFRSLTTASGRASDLASNWHEARNLDFTRDYVEELSHVTASDLRRVIKTYLVPQRLTITSLDPEGTSENLEQAQASAKREAIQSRTLDNGLTLITQRDPRLPTVSITVATLTGLPSETQETSGINALLASLMPKGTHSRSAKEIALTMDSMGARFGVSCGNNTTLASASCLAPDLEHTLTILADVIQTPILPDDALDRERNAMISALREQEEDPLSVAFRRLRPSLFGPEGYGLHSLGTENSLHQLDRDALLAHHQKYFTAANTVIAVFGDIDPDAAAAMVQQQFANMPRGERMQAVPQDFQEASRHALKLDKQQAVLTVGFPGASASDPDTHALELINDYCTDMAGPLFTKIREELGLAYYVSATQFHGINTGMFAFYLGTSPDQLATAQDHLLAEIDKIAENGIPEEKLDNVKTTWLASHALANQKLGSLARLSAIDSLLGFEPDHHLKAPEHIRKLSADDIRAAARKFLSNHQAVVVSVSPSH
ncbi:insulinase family protein [Verrucomicrobiaceae bacterium N1E253]|uniref:Insulinase family protein n=1 Tax=Oceaniferula marina TaxID=2748318 RepID=A0A851GAN5_9BACT|nr:pitrilysin family protein [Oceaniferula marina]NWK54032.1 insulinase family protein [Oceaniferula marina]